MSIQIPDLEHAEQSALNDLFRQYYQKLPRNRLRQQYYDSKNLLKDLGIAIPPDMVNLDMVLGWPAKAVDGISRRSKMDGFVIPNLNTADLGLDAVMAANNMQSEVPQAQTSAFLHSCAFVSTTLGDVKSGEPPVLMNTASAMAATGIWDPRRRRLASALAIVDTAQSGAPTAFILYMPDCTISVEKVGTAWKVDRRKHALKRVPVELLRYKPRIDRPFGSSRISRPVISLADSGLRTVIRMEVSAEFYSSPQRWIMGADESAFLDAEGNLKTQWQAIMGRIWAVGPDEDGNLPQVGTFTASSQQSHIEHLRSQATQFSGETGIPVGSLGVVQDNPSSAEAIFAAKEDLLIEAEFSNDEFGSCWRKSALTALQLLHKLPEIPEEWLGLRAKYRDPATPSRSAAADSVVKIISAFPWLADSPVALEQLGWDETTVARALADKRKAGLSGILERLANVDDPEAAALAARRGDESGPLDNADELRKKFEALGVATRAGVDRDDAARRLGLDGIKFTGVPVSVRVDESQAQGLEAR